VTKTPGYTGVQWMSILDREEYPGLKKKKALSNAQFLEIVYLMLFPFVD
jgi:hypothetical protein